MVFADKLEVVQGNWGWIEMDISDLRSASLPSSKLLGITITSLQDRQADMF
jgi:hypothetical protein